MGIRIDRNHLGLKMNFYLLFIPKFLRTDHNPFK